MKNAAPCILGLLLYCVVQAAAEPIDRTEQRGVDWPCFLGPSHDGTSTETGISTEWDEQGPTLLWHRKLGTSYGIGSVSAGRYYQFDRFGDRATLICLHARTGRFLWKFDYPTDYVDMLGYNNGPRASPVIDENRVYLFGAEGMLHCIDADNGRLIWKVDTFERFGVVQNFFGVGTCPVVDNDLLIVMIGGSPPESQDVGRWDLDRVVGNGTCIVAFDKRTGHVQYTVSNELASYSTPRIVTIDERPWGFAFARGGLVGFHPKTGSLDFHYPWRSRLHDSVNAATPVVVGNQVFISETYGPGSSLLKVSPGGYDIVWRDGKTRYPAMKSYWNTPIYHDGHLYGSSGRDRSTAELRCIEWKTGRICWSQPGLTRSSLLYVDDHFVCLSENGRLRLIRATPNAYTEVAQASVRENTNSDPLITEPAWAAPILSHGLLYLRGRDRVVCLQLIPR